MKKIMGLIGRLLLVGIEAGCLLILIPVFRAADFEGSFIGGLFVVVLSAYIVSFIGMLLDAIFNFATEFDNFDDFGDFWQKVLWAPLSLLIIVLKNILGIFRYIYESIFDREPSYSRSDAEHFYSYDSEEPDEEEVPARQRTVDYRAFESTLRYRLGDLEWHYGSGFTSRSQFTVQYAGDRVTVVIHANIKAKEYCDSYEFSQYFESLRDTVLERAKEILYEMREKYSNYDRYTSMEVTIKHDIKMD